MQGKNPIRYPLVELLTGYIFVHLYYVFIQYRHESPCIFICYIALCSALIISTFVDLELLVIPNEVTFVGIPLALVLSVICPGLHDAQNTLRNFSLTGIYRLDTLIASMIGMLVGGGMIFLCSILGKWVFKKDAMGLGDVKLMGMIGGITGWKLAVSIFFVAPFFGLLMAVPVLLFKKKHLIPYGPFFVVGCAGVYPHARLFYRTCQCVCSTFCRIIFWIPFINPLLIKDSPPKRGDGGGAEPFPDPGRGQVWSARACPCT